MTVREQENNEEFMYPKPEYDESPVYEDDVDAWENTEKVLYLMVCAECGRISDLCCPYHLSDNWEFKAKVVK